MNLFKKLADKIYARTQRSLERDHTKDPVPSSEEALLQTVKLMIDTINLHTDVLARHEASILALHQQNIASENAKKQAMSFPPTAGLKAGSEKPN